jgi:pantothenate kinase
VKATGGGSYKYADLFKERLGIILDKEDEMDCLVQDQTFFSRYDPDKLLILLIVIMQIISHF